MRGFLFFVQTINEVTKMPLKSEHAHPSCKGGSPMFNFSNRCRKRKMTPCKNLKTKLSGNYPMFIAFHTLFDIYVCRICYIFTPTQEMPTTYTWLFQNNSITIYVLILCGNFLMLIQLLYPNRLYQIRGLTY